MPPQTPCKPKKVGRQRCHGFLQLGNEKMQINFELPNLLHRSVHSVRNSHRPNIATGLQIHRAGPHHCNIVSFSQYSKKYANCIHHRETHR